MSTHRHVSPLQTPPVHRTAAPWVADVGDTARRLGFDMNVCLAALSLASHAHAPQVRSADGTPYIGHVVSVAEAYALHPISTENGYVAALLHDVLEDAPSYGPAARQLFGDGVFDLVLCLTKNDQLPRQGRNEDAHRRLLGRKRLAAAS